MTITTPEKIKYLKNKFKDGKPPKRKKSNKKINPNIINRRSYENEMKEYKLYLELMNKDKKRKSKRIKFK